MFRAAAFAGLALAGCAAAAEPTRLTIHSNGTMQIAAREVSCADLRNLPSNTALQVEAAEPNVTYAEFSEVWTCLQTLKMPISLIGEDAEQT